MSAIFGRWLLILTATLALAAPVLAPNRPSDQFTDRNYAPPTRVHVRDQAGFHAPFIYKQVVGNRLLREFGEDTSVRVPIVWGADGQLASVPGDRGPLLLLGGDDLGRDIFSRLLFGARLSLGVTCLGAIGALVLGAFVGGIAGGTGGRTDTALMFIADFMLVLPAVYLVLVFRGAMMPVLPWGVVFGLMALIFALVGWPRVARGVRGIVATERARDYALAARAAGASPLRVLGHLLPATRGFLGVELVLLVPAMLMAETTISYLGLGFPEPTPSWGTMLQQTSNVQMMADAPWLLTPAVALFAVVLGLQLVARSAATGPRASPRGAPSRFRVPPRPSAGMVPGRS
jgi:peptide/nickel transport system permease protein